MLENIFLRRLKGIVIGAKSFAPERERGILGIRQPPQ